MTTTYAPADIDRDTTIARLRHALRMSTGQNWSVTGGRGTSWGWITVTSPPARRDRYGCMTDEDRATLAQALRLLTTKVHVQGVLIPGQTDYRIEYLQRAEGAEIAVRGVAQWD